jgi:Peptidase_C39 like family
MVKPRLLSALVGLMTATVLVTMGWGATGVAVASSSPQLSDSAVAAYKAANDTEAAYVSAVAASYAQHNAQKRAMYQSGSLHAAASASVAATSAVSGSGYAYLSPLNQQGEQRSYWCGPATVSMLAWTVPGPSNVSQSTSASWMGTNTSGTSESQETSGLNHFVGVPDYGWNFYGFVAMNGNPTSSQRATFLGDLKTDVSLNSPVAGDAWEVVNGPHLVGHPNQQIFHWFEIGGWNTNNGKVYYADPATSVWSTVPPYSWLSTNTVETILGGRGYAW